MTVDYSGNVLVLLQDVDARLSYLEEFEAFNKSGNLYLKPYFAVALQNFWDQYAAIGERLRAVIMDVYTDGYWMPQYLLFHLQARNIPRSFRPVIINTFDPGFPILDGLDKDLHYYGKKTLSQVTLLCARRYMNDLSRVLRHVLGNTER